MIFFSWSTFNSHRYYLTFLFLENTYEHIPRAAVDRSKIRTVTNIAVRCFTLSHHRISCKSMLRVLSRERALIFFSSLAKTGPLRILGMAYDSSWWRRREREKREYIYIYFDTLRLCRIKSVGRYAHSESIHAVTWNPDMQDDYALLGNVLMTINYCIWNYTWYTYLYIYIIVCMKNMKKNKWQIIFFNFFTREFKLDLIYYFEICQVFHFVDEK